MTRSRSQRCCAQPERYLGFREGRGALLALGAAPPWVTLRVQQPPSCCPVPPPCRCCVQGAAPLHLCWHVRGLLLVVARCHGDAHHARRRNGLGSEEARPHGCRASAPFAFAFPLGWPSLLLSSESELEPESDELLESLLLLPLLLLDPDPELRRQEDGTVKHCRLDTITARSMVLGTW